MSEERPFKVPQYGVVRIDRHIRWVSGAETSDDVWWGLADLGPDGLQLQVIRTYRTRAEAEAALARLGERQP